jgi:hypothetical protein
MVLKVLGAALLIFLALSLIGAVFKFLGAALVIGAIVLVGAAGYSALKGSKRKQLP